MQSKTIKILLIDGNPTGIKIADIGGRVARAIYIPRNKIKNDLNREELNSVGIYFLIGQDIETDQQLVYVGEAENVHRRLLQHNKDNEKDFWNLSICFLSKDDSLTKAHVKFLENYCHGMIKLVNRCFLINSTVPAKTNLPEIEIADAMDFFDSIKLLISTLGYPIFDKLSSESDDKIIYKCKGPDANASGEYTNEGFVVFEGSAARKTHTATAGKWVKNLTNNLVNKQVLISEGENSLIFTRDYLFKSPSAAAATVLARRANGWREWKDEKGNSLDKNERQ